MTQELETSLPHTASDADRRPANRWPSVSAALSVAAALAAVGGVALHFLGEVAHSVYLRAWGIDAELFPKSTDWLLVHGYYVLFDRSLAALKAVGNDLLMFFAWAIGIGLYIFVLLTPINIPMSWIPAWLKTRPSWLERLIRQVTKTVLVVLLLPLALILVLAFMAIPAAMGETTGQSIAQRDQKRFAQGCTEKTPCIEFTKAGALLAKGFMLDGSASHIAIFDTGLQRARVLERAGLEMLAHGLLDPTSK